ncbi:ABC transporter ATP-binding protein [Propylenella binzhouense]|uniref:ABC transporter ATP-binding protein n=1 Tax=Propylenella binzhouense TaxID=2555902 RepID=A0A964T2U7_9HYPH|nr:ABC transporter ATP-binding protein [Propylenella binzhouense]MYZ47274.1 ABC transporter ATP-binding protein [Propylenella binzhouense]
MPIIELAGVSKRFEPPRGAPAVDALRDVTLSIDQGSFVVLLGPSGCGKTTLLRLVDGLLPPDSGSVRVFGRAPVPGPGMGFVFQSFRLVPWSTVRGNVEFALAGTGLDRAARRERAEHYLELVGLARFASAYPGELSGGMKQRAALARALAPEPEILLMDEPFASIDAQTRELMQAELMRLWALRRSVVLFVTHSVDEAILLADRVVLMGPRPGRILEAIEVELPRPRWRYDVRAEPRFIELRAYLWNRIRELVLSDENSDFFGRSRDF